MKQSMDKEVREIELRILMIEESLAQIRQMLYNPNISCQDRERLLLNLFALDAQYTPERVQL